MGEVLSYVKVNLSTMLFVVLGDETRKKRIRNGVLLFILFIITVEYSLIKSFNTFSEFRSEIVVFNFILNIQAIMIIFFVFARVTSTVYLESDWKEMIVYPIKSGSLLVSKCILSYIVSLVVTIPMLIPLFTYGILIKAGILYYLGVLGFQIVMPFIPTIYIVLISLTLSWAISGIKGTKYTHKNNKWFILVILAVLGLTYLLVKDIPNGKVGTFLINTFFYGNPNLSTSLEITMVLTKVVITLAIILVFSLGVHLTGGDVYIKVMKSGIFTSSDSKKVEFNLENYKFKTNSPIMSNVIRDLRLITRIPIVRTSCVTMNLVLSIAFMVITLLIRDKLILFGSSNNADGLKSILVIALFMLLIMFNFTLITSFSREGRALSRFKAFPISRKDFLISKIIVGVISNIFAFISLSIFIVIISSSIINFILLEAVLVVCTIGTAIILAATDSGSIEAKWVEIKDLFGSMHAMKSIIPVYIITFSTFIPGFILIGTDIKLKEHHTASIILAIIIIYSLLSYKKIKRNMI